jgi:hypothetical protein
MQLRSGRCLSFERVLNEDSNAWPNEEQAYRLSTSVTDPELFIKHISDLMKQVVDKADKKTNRLVAMATARSLMNVSENRFMRLRFQSLAKTVLRKFEEYDGPEVLEFRMDDWIRDFKMFII